MISYAYCSHLALQAWLPLPNYLATMQLAGLVPTFVTRITLIIYDINSLTRVNSKYLHFAVGREGAYTRDKTTYAGTSAKKCRCGILRYRCLVSFAVQVSYSFFDKIMLVSSIMIIVMKFRVQHYII